MAQPIGMPFDARQCHLAFCGGCDLFLAKKHKLYIMASFYTAYFLF